MTTSRIRLFGLALWATIVVGGGSQTFATYTLKGEEARLADSILWSFNDWVGWLLLGPLVFYLAKRFPVEPPNVKKHLGLHAAAALVTSALHGALYWGMEGLTGELWPEMTPLQLLPVYVFKTLVLGILIYAVLAGTRHALEFYRRYRERERQLSKAQLEVLKMQLQPHFLFNTLHAISALITKDPEAADRIITRLGDLLRMSLQSNGTQEVPLAKEIEFVEKYVEIQQTRFQDRLVIRIVPEPEALEGLVPSLLLQPLIENSIRHGVERREAAAHIEVSARRVGARLVIEVADDGPGFPDCNNTPLPGRGLGLSNTRARIDALYGADGRLTTGVAPLGGALVVIDLPFRTQPLA